MLAKRLLSLFPVVLIVVLSDACVQHSAVNADCLWTEDADGVLLHLSNQTDLAHLSDDAGFAEDLAIRYADVQKGHRSGRFETAVEYGRTRDACMAALFAVIADEHGVRPAEVRDALMHRPLAFDLAVFASFFVLYGWIVYAIARWMIAAFSLERPWSVVVVTLLASGPIALAGFMSGGLWSGVFEMLRIGNTHMSYRVFRVPWGQHPLGLFTACLGVFWLVMILRYKSQAACSDLKASA
jgi:hypothetical protein